MRRASRYFLLGHFWHLIHNHLFVKDSEESVIARSPARCWVCAPASGVSLIDRRCGGFEVIADMLYYHRDLDGCLSQQAGRG